MNSTAPAATTYKAVRTPTGTKVHKADGSMTNCGLHLRRLIVVNIEQVAAEFKCDKCYAAKFKS